MKNLFVFGTLLDETLRAKVLGRTVAGEPASLPDATIRRAAAGDWPVLVPMPGARAEGLLLRDLDDEGLDRLHFYEEGFDYLPMAAPVTRACGDDAEALVYRARVAAPASDEAWSLADWQDTWGPMTRHAAEEVMQLHGRIDGETLRRRMPVIRYRADAARRAAAEPAPRGPTADWTRADVQVHHDDRPYSDFFVMRETELTHPRFEGGRSRRIKRGALVTGDAITVLPYDPGRDRVLIIEQFRYGVFARGDTHPWILEPVAGRIDAGEGPEQAARREAAEEACVTLDELLFMGRYYPSPGCVTEYVYSYVGLCDLPDAAAGLGGAQDEDEDIKSHLMGFDDLLAMMARGEIASAPLLMTTLWLQRERAVIRGVG